MGKKELDNYEGEGSQFQVDLEIASFVLRSGGTIVYPTETIWGLGCDACSEDAVDQLIELKRIDIEKPFIVLVDSVEMIERYVSFFPETAKKIIQNAKEPTTIIYPNACNLATNVLAPDGSIGIRITTNHFCKEIIQNIKKPIVSTSANFFGKPSPKTFNDIDIDIIYNADYVVRWGQQVKTPSKPSKIIKLLPTGETENVR